MAYTITPLSGIDLNDTQTVAEQTANAGLVTFGPLGAEIFASDGSVMFGLKLAQLSLLQQQLALSTLLLL